MVELLTIELIPNLPSLIRFCPGSLFSVNASGTGCSHAVLDSGRLNIDSEIQPAAAERG